MDFKVLQGSAYLFALSPEMDTKDSDQDLAIACLGHVINILP